MLLPRSFVLSSFFREVHFLPGSWDGWKGTALPPARGPAALSAPCCPLLELRSLATPTPVSVGPQGVACPFNRHVPSPSRLHVLPESQTLGITDRRSNRRESRDHFVFGGSPASSGSEGGRGAEAHLSGPPPPRAVVQSQDGGHHEEGGEWGARGAGCPAGGRGSAAGGRPWGAGGAQL